MKTILEPTVCVPPDLKVYTRTPADVCVLTYLGEGGGQENTLTRPNTTLIDGPSFSLVTTSPNTSGYNQGEPRDRPSSRKSGRGKAQKRINSFSATRENESWFPKQFQVLKHRNLRGPREYGQRPGRSCSSAGTEHPHRARRPAPPARSHAGAAALLTIAFSCELLACAMPRMLVVCITSTEKLGSQLAIRDPKTSKNPAQIRDPFPRVVYSGVSHARTPAGPTEACYRQAFCTGCFARISSLQHV